MATIPFPHACQYRYLYASKIIADLSLKINKTFSFFAEQTATWSYRYQTWPRILS